MCFVELGWAGVGGRNENKRGGQSAHFSVFLWCHVIYVVDVMGAGLLSL